MKTKAVLMILVIFLLTACDTMYHKKRDQPQTRDQPQKRHQPPIALTISEGLTLQLVDGKLDVLDEEGIVKDVRRVRTPFEVCDKDCSAKTIESIQTFTLITIKGSCQIICGTGDEYAVITLPDWHPYCQQQDR
jgi:uncharacterized lipoprotein